jgi:hypothetical protein
MTFPRLSAVLLYSGLEFARICAARGPQEHSETSRSLYDAAVNSRAALRFQEKARTIATVAAGQMKIQCCASRHVHTRSCCLSCALVLAVQQRALRVAPEGPRRRSRTALDVPEADKCSHFLAKASLGWIASFSQFLGSSRKIVFNCGVRAATRGRGW